jgi:NTP pyrophosphatase (non-canonical NTP hydrolase)
MSHFNQLTPAEAERLAILAEECGEVVQVIGKILRHGWGDDHPDYHNRLDLERELGDVLAIVKRMAAEHDVDDASLIANADVKYQKTIPYLHHQDVL